MIMSVAVTAGMAVVAMLPGLFLTKGWDARPGQRAAAATASLVVAMLISALFGSLASLFSSRLPIQTFLLVSLAGCGGAWFFARNKKAQWAPVELSGIGIAIIFLAYGFLTQGLAVQEDSDGNLLVHAWYNADWFKHLGHVAGLANFGLPASDAFNGGSALHYYWLSYILPAAGASVGGDNWAALNAANVVIIALFCLTFYGTVRMASSTAPAAFTAALLILFVCAPLGFFLVALKPGGTDLLLNWPGAPKSPALSTIAKYIPQHALALATLLAWVLLNRPDAKAPEPLRWLSLAMLAGAMTLSTLLGAIVLGVYGLLTLWERKLKAVPEVATMAVIASLLVIILGVVQLDDPNSAIESPLLTNVPDPKPWFERGAASAADVISNLGIPLLVALIALRFWRPEDDASRYAMRLAIVTMVTGIAAAVVAEVLLAPRLAIETRIRAVNIPAIGVAIAGGWAISHWWQGSNKARIAIIATLGCLTLLALPSQVANLSWHAQVGDQYTTRVPQDDRAVLAYLKGNSDARSIVWQYPEPPLLGSPSGHDAWSVVLGGRTVSGSLRATNYSSAAHYIQLAERFFTNQPVEVPAHISWVYLSRILHPNTYDAVLARMEADRAWRKRACYPDACLFSRIAAQ